MSMSFLGRPIRVSQPPTISAPVSEWLPAGALADVVQQSGQQQQVGTADRRTSRAHSTAVCIRCRSTV